MTSSRMFDPVASSIQKLGPLPAVLDLLTAPLAPLPSPYHNPRELLDSLLLEFDADQPSTVGSLLQVLSTPDQGVNASPYAVPAHEAILDSSPTTRAPFHEPLSGQEAAVLRLLGAGYANREIATALVISRNTVKTHLRNLYRKLDVGTRLEAVARARSIGLM